jgi:phospholipase DDHD1
MNFSKLLKLLFQKIVIKGSVIVYDILTASQQYSMFSNAYGEDSNREKLIFNHFSNNDSNLFNEYLTCKNRMQEIERNLLQSNKNITTILFSAENLFILGSPLAVFLALRGVRPAGVGTQDHILPKHLCKRLFNVFHPSDPIVSKFHHSLYSFNFKIT